MTKYNPFRVSFDGPLATRERTRAQIAATLIGGAAIVLGAMGMLTLLNASSNTLGAWSNGKPDGEVRMLAREGDDPAGKPCEQQTWPYIEQRCLKRADAKSSERSTPKHGLGSQRVVLPGAPAAAGSQREAKPAQGSGTTGAAPAEDRRQEEERARKPVRAATQAPPHAIGTDAARQRHGTEPSRSARERRKQQREEVRLQRERREEARRARAQARENARRTWRDEEMVRWRGDARYATPFGPFDDGFFRFR